jgi:hypothetical protein
MSGPFEKKIKKAAIVSGSVVVNKDVKKPAGDKKNARN